MRKKILAFFAMLYAAVSFAAVDANKADAADLDGIKGIGPGLSAKIIAERKNGSFKDWNDFIGRVSGIGEKTASHLSTQGLTVNGKPFNTTPAKTAEAAAPKTGASGTKK